MVRYGLNVWDACDDCDAKDAKEYRMQLEAMRKVENDQTSRQVRGTIYLPSVTQARADHGLRWFTGQKRKYWRHIDYPRADAAYKHIYRHWSESHRRISYILRSHPLVVHPAVMDREIPVSGWTRNRRRREWRCDAGIEWWWIYCDASYYVLCSLILSD